MTVM